MSQRSQPARADLSPEWQAVLDEGRALFEDEREFRDALREVILRAAVRAGALEAMPNGRDAGDYPSATEMCRAARIIIGFLRALPEGYINLPDHSPAGRQLGMTGLHARLLADAVEIINVK